jgi:acyl carrier protein
MHLGASVLRHAESIAGFISGTLGAPQVAALLTQAIADLQATAAGFASTFSDGLAHDQWLHFQAGRLGSAAMVLAAAQKRRAADGEEDASTHAAEWAMRRFIDLRHAILGWFSAQRRELSSSKLVNIIGRYTMAIGDVEQQLAGEGQGPDQFIRRGNDAQSRADAVVESGSHAPAASTEALEEAINRSDELSKLLVREIGVASDGIDVYASGSEKSHATRRMIHDSVVKWLRVEKRRTVDKLDDGVSFSSLGMDSLGAITLTLELERRIGVELSPEILHECQTIGRLAAYIDANVPFAPHEETEHAALRH